VKRSSHIALVAIFALAIQSLGFCAGAAAGCTTSVCAAHQQDGSCPRHPHDSEQESRHLCCVYPICLNGAELTAGKDASMSYVSMLLPVVFSLRSVDLAKLPGRLAALAWVHAPPLHVPIFLSMRTLLI
jgi:hypothetical protein